MAEIQPIQNCILKNGRIFYRDESFQAGDLVIVHGIIRNFIPQPEAAASSSSDYKKYFYNSDTALDETFEILNLDGGYLIPGLIDTHFHGCGGYDFSDATMTALSSIAAFELAHGTTAILPATMTLPEEELLKICENAVCYQTTLSANHSPCPEETLRSHFLGFYMEGPFFSSEKAGAQRRDCLRLPDIAFARRLLSKAGGLLKIWAFAPELRGALPFLQELSGQSVLLSIGHTMASSAAARAAFEAGAQRITHLYNGMNFPMEIIREARSFPNVYAELISDGIHNSPQRIHYAFQQFGNRRIILISDSMRATGLGDGTYTLGGQNVSVTGKKALLPDGKKAGSVSTLYDCLKTTVSLGIPLESAVRAATCNPARSLQMNDTIGSIRTGCIADLILLSDDLTLQKVFKASD